MIVNNIPSACLGDCTFHYAKDVTPEVTGVTPVLGSSGTSVTISGSGFERKLVGDSDGSNEDVEEAEKQEEGNVKTVCDVDVIIGGVACEVTDCTDTRLVCKVGEGESCLNVKLIG